MTVKELIEELQKFPPEMPVRVPKIEDTCYDTKADLELNEWEDSRTKDEKTFIFIS